MSKEWEGFESPHEHKVPAEALIWKHDFEVMGNGWNTWENGCRHCGKDKPKKQPTNMVTIPLDKLEDMQRRLKEQPTKEEILGKVFDAVYAQYQPKAETQEPVLYIDEGGLDGHATWAQATRCQATDIALYTHPKEWQSLSNDDINGAVKFLNVRIEYPIMFARLIEMHLKEKNT